MSETKETEAGAGPEKESPPRASDAGPDSSAAAGAESSGAEEAVDAEPSASGEGTAETETDGNEPGEAQATSSPKKKKKKKDVNKTESIRDRNERVRAEAAEKRRARRAREQQGTAPRRNLDAGEMVDDALARSTHAAAGFLRAHFNKVQWVIVGGLACWIGWEVYSWRQARHSEKATAELFSALSAEMGKVSGEGNDEVDPNTGLSDTRRSFPSDEERLKTAKKEYLAAGQAMAKGPVSGVLADLGAAGVEYDLGQYKEAEAAYLKVKQYPEFGTNTDIRGRTLEGLGMALEAQKKDDAALKAFRELASMDSAAFAALGMYHQARVLNAQGKTADALKLLEKAGEKLVLLKDTPAVIKYLRTSVLELYESLDATKARELSQKLLPADVLKQLQETLGTKLGMPGGALPQPAPAPTTAPAPAPPEDAPQDAAPTTPGPFRDTPAPQAPPTPAPAPAPATSGAP